jgi:xylan 1,4-beta-xylosidase
MRGESLPARRCSAALFVAVVMVLASPALAQRDASQVSIRIDASKRLGPMTPMWAFFGHDEPNYTYMPDGQKLLSELASLSPVPVYLRVHNLLTTGDGTPALKWGSTNAYTEDAAGHPVYDWTIVDRIFDTYMKRKMKPLVQIGFMPKALSTKPEPYQHNWAAGVQYSQIYTGWAYPPTDYSKWGELVHQWALHTVQRYGANEVKTWYWEVWNEPDIGYWQGTPEEFQKLYDFAADAVKRALPEAKVGGPEVTGPNGARTQQLLKDFIEHSLRGTNYATGQRGSPLDFVTFHAKGAPRVVDGHVRMGISNQLRAISNGFQIVASYPELRNTPIVIGESDPEGCAACSVRTNPENAYRNGTVYSSYTAAQIARTFELADLHHVNLLGSVTWAFEFEGQPPFAGFRDLATNGIDKPVLNVFRMLGKMHGDRVAVTSTSAATIETIRDAGVRGEPDIYALATRSDHAMEILVWNYHDDDVASAPATVTMAIEGLSPGRPTITQYRVDDRHSNAYQAWKALGSPQSLTSAQRSALEKAGQLESIGPPARQSIDKGRLTIDVSLPRQGVALFTIAY